LDFYYNSLTAVSIDLSSGAVQRGGASIDYGNGHWTGIRSGKSGSFPEGIVFEDDGASSLETDSETSGSAPLLWRLGDEENLIYKTRELSRAFAFTGVGDDAAEWTFEPKFRITALESDPTGVVLMSAGIPEPDDGYLTGLYISGDSGATWTKNLPIAAQEGEPYNLCIANAFDANMWVVGRIASYIFWTIDQGVTWVNRNGNAGQIDDEHPTVTTIRQIRIGYNAPSK